MLKIFRLEIILGPSQYKTVSDTTNVQVRNSNMNENSSTQRSENAAVFNSDVQYNPPSSAKMENLTKE